MMFSKPVILTSDAVNWTYDNEGQEYIFFEFEKSETSREHYEDVDSQPRWSIIELIGAREL